MTTLANAMRAFVSGGFDRTKMDVEAWTKTYPPAGMEDIRAAYEVAMTRHSQQQHNNCEEQG